MDDDELNNKLRAWGDRAIVARAVAAQALARLLDQAERGHSGQVRHIAQLLAPSFDGQDAPRMRVHHQLHRVLPDCA